MPLSSTAFFSFLLQDTFLFQSVMQIEVGYNESAIIFRQLSHIEWIPQSDQEKDSLIIYRYL